jgi:hypothetical protein
MASADSHETLIQGSAGTHVGLALHGYDYAQWLHETPADSHETLILASHILLMWDSYVVKYFVLFYLQIEQQKEKTCYLMILAQLK